MSRADRNLARMRADAESDWPTRLLHDIADAPLLDERQIDAARRTEASPAELRVLERLSHGDTRTETARALGIAIGTVKQHLANAKAALLTRSTTESCCEALRRRLIP